MENVLDVLADLLSTMRLSGGVFLDGEFRTPWSVWAHLGPDDCATFFPGSRQMIAYHFVRAGRLVCEIKGQPPLTVEAGEIVILPRNEPHLLHGSIPASPVDAHKLIEPARKDGLLQIRSGGEGELTAIYCGFLGSLTADNMLLMALPSIMKIGASGLERGDWIERSLDFAVHGLSQDSPEMVGKMAESLFAEAVRRYMAALPPEEIGWLAGLRDTAVGRTLARIHQHYADAWTLDLLAREAGGSETVLVDRFRALIGESPMQYCARWRMHVAAEMLRDNGQNACSVAYSVGFNSEAAFNRAFKREFGLPPAAWQRSRAGA